MEQLKADAANTAAKIVAEMSRYAPPAGRHNADPFATLGGGRIPVSPRPMICIALSLCQSDAASGAGISRLFGPSVGGPHSGTTGGV